MKTIGNQVKGPIGLRFPMRPHTGIQNCRYSIFCGYNNTTNREQTKNQLKIARKHFRSRKALLQRTQIRHYATSY